MAKRRTQGHRSPKNTKPGEHKAKYKVRNWSEYNDALGRRGEITVWIDPDFADRWYVVFPPPRTDRRGRPPKRQPPEHHRHSGRPALYTDYAIGVVLQLGTIYHQPLRQAEHLMRSIFRLMHLSLSVPDYSTLCRRADALAIALPKRRASVTGPLHVLLDATGLKVFGDGEWKVRLTRGFGCYRSWRKFHLLVLADGEIRAAHLDSSHRTDEAMTETLLAQEPGPIASFTADGAYDRSHVYDTLIERKVNHIIIPPRSNAKIMRHGNTQSQRPHPRDEHLRRIRQVGRRRWKEEQQYSVRSKIENTIFRLKTIFGERLHARLITHQRTEALMKAAALNRMMMLGMPQSYKVC